MYKYIYTKCVCVEWKTKRDYFTEEILKRFKKAEQIRFKNRNQIYTKSLKQYLADLNCKSKNPGSRARCNETTTDCKCIKKTFSANSLANSCIYEDDLINCIGSSYKDREFIIERKPKSKDIMICPSDPKWKIHDEIIKEDKDQNSLDQGLYDKFLKEKTRLSESTIEKVLKTFGKNPINDVFSDLYYYNTRRRETIENDEEYKHKDQTDYCDYFNIIQEVHGLNFSRGKCPGTFKRCDPKEPYSHCKFVKKRYYKTKGEEFYLEFEDFSLSSIFSVYLEKEDNKCGQSQTNSKNEEEKNMFLKVKIYNEIDFPPRRFFNLGPFGPFDTEGKMKVCACSNYTKDKIYSCVKLEDYDLEIGELIIRDKIDFKNEEIYTLSDVEIKLENQKAFMIESKMINGDCTNISEKYKIDWKNSIVEEMPNLSEHILYNKNNRIETKTVLTPYQGGKFNVCLINFENAEIITQPVIYIVKGVKNNVNVVAYCNSENKIVVQPILVELIKMEKTDIESIYISDSKDRCIYNGLGSYKGSEYEYNSPNKVEGTKFLLYTGFKFVVEKDFDVKVICAKYKNKSKDSGVGYVYKKRYVDFNQENFDKVLGLDGIQHDSMYNYEVKNKDLFKTWIEKFKGTSTQESPILKDGDLDSLFDKYFDVIQIRTFNQMNLVTLWITNKDEILMFPVYKLTLESPSKIRMAVISGKIYWYVLMREKRLIVKYDFTEIKDKYVIEETTNYNIHTLHNPSDFELLQNGERVRIVLIDSYVSCILLLNESLTKVNSLDKNNKDAGIVNPTSLSCTKTGEQSSVFNCFVTETTTDEIVWFSVNIENDELKYVSRYTSGTQVNDVDPILGSIVSLETLNYSDANHSVILLFIIRENYKYGAILSADSKENQINFLSTINKIPGYWNLKSINVAYNGPVQYKLFLTRESYINDPIIIGSEIEDIFNKMRDRSNVKWAITWIPLMELISLPELNYDIKGHLTINEMLTVMPQFKDNELLNKRIYFYIQAYIDSKDYVDSIININSVTGELKINVNKVKFKVLKFNIISKILVIEKKSEISIKFSCLDGEYYDNGSCSKCPKGSYNSIELELKSDTWLECIQCPKDTVTEAVGSKSIDYCTCDKGYSFFVDPNTRKEVCMPCPPGTYKSTLGSHPCIGSCYKNSISKVVGSTSEDERKCECLPGFYWKDDENTKECLECEKGNYCTGGFKSKAIKCPENTSSNSRSTSINDCKCKEGYEPIWDDEKVSIIEEPESESKNTLEFKCFPCKKNMYKDTKSNEKCKQCPKYSNTLETGSTKLTDCNICDEGFFETKIENEPCRMCKKDSYCVGSLYEDNKGRRISGKNASCPEHSITIKPYNKNVSMLNCLCVEGFVPVTSGSSVKCIPAPKDHYKDVIGNVPAVPCPHGSLTMSNGATSKDACVCDKGTYFDIVSKHCAICPAGKYCLGGKDDKMNDRQPMECSDSNAQTKAPGASSSSECACKEGYYMDVDAQNTCKECPENHYKSYISNDMCSRCDENSSTTGKKGATSKEQCVCDPGYYFDRGCVSCNFNDKYCPGGVIEIKDDVGRSRVVTRSPIPCPPNTEIPPGVDNASSINFCKCTKGYYFVSEDLENNKKVCNACAPGTYKSSVMDSSCNGLCTQNATSFPGAESSNHCFCLMGYFYLEGGICSKCMEGAKCEGGLINYKMKTLKNFVVNIDDHVKPVAVEGYFLDKINPKLRKPDDWKFIKCPINGSCLGNDKCSDTMEHYLCSECKKGYTNNFVKGALCQKCPRMRPNISITILYYFGLLLINIVMARLNISSGYNRRSIHSVVIKIALNFGICTSVVNVVNFSDLKLPVGLRKMINKWVKVFDSDDAVYYTSIDCVIRSLFNLEHSDSFFYTMLYMACFPLILLFIVTLMMWIIMVLFKLVKYNDIRRKLALLQQFKAKYEGDNQDSLIEQYRNERLLMILRYIPLPNETSWDRFKNFLEDMIPIYVTVLFSVHGKITSRLLSLLDCTYIDLGRSFPGKYVLRPAMSIRCSINPSEGYLRYLILGLCGLLVWGLGIPFLSFMALFVNRNNLYAPSIRMKYGFLHNGFRQDYWYWETVVFARKCLVLVIGSIVIVPSENYSGSRIWMALVVAVTFLILQLIYKPFDERDYFVLGRLENHSMITWTFTLILVSFIIEANFTPSYNMSLLSFIVFINFLFLFELIFQLFVAYCHNFRIQNTSPKSFFTRFFYHFLTKISNKIKNAEPIIYFDPSTCTTNLRSSKKFINKSIFDNIDVISYNEKDYFSYVMNEIICFANIRMKLDVIPCDFPEYITRLTFAVYFNESSKQKMNNLVKSFADGNIDKLVNISMINDNYNNQHKNNKKTYIDDNIVVDPYLMFDNELLSKGMPLSDFYVALSIIKLKDLRSIANTYVYFREYKNNEKIFNLGRESKKLNDLDEIAKKLNEPDSCENIEELFCSEAELEELYKKIEEVEEKIRMFKKNPLNALKIYYSDEYSHIESGDFESDLIAFGFRKKSGDPRI
ncbi:cysteine repeat modular protein 2 [Theileria annulata]|uniref:Cysteine repeat modular protein 2 homologue, putative n=1 Tax=Theileria annulata TaxID=5874 RepID=Q4UIN5_THEAN|nr:cysteine repeat modular protein 2 [Theileria annulata]CAI73054.1 cysteine repeat modular protein 2 homologue, putative [Theileria annulata]|eukprot:XP_953732.1 cysteine repeat modular protein 2 homologue, putative [Theileria annulata]